MSLTGQVLLFKSPKEKVSNKFQKAQMVIKIHKDLLKKKEFLSKMQVEKV